MCYSALVWSDYRRYVRAFGAELDVKEFYNLFWRRKSDPTVKIPKAVEAAFVEPSTDLEREIKVLIEKFAADQGLKLQQELFKQRKRIADAERSLQVKTTRKAEDDQRIAGAKVGRAMSKLADLGRAELEERDSRIFPGVYAPVMVMEEGKRVIKPMRYQCRPCGKPAFYDRKYSGTYNARRDNLEGFWKGLFGFSHGLMVVNAFYENVKRHRMEGRELRDGEEPENVVLEFKPQSTHNMLVACLWSRWSGPNEPDLLSFAAITDEPPPEVSAAGHDRCIVPIRQENIDTWLNPDKGDLKALYVILDDRARPYYEHRMAA